MGKVTKAANHLSVTEILDRMKQPTPFWCLRRWMIIHHALVSPSPAPEIAQRFGVSKHTVHQLISRYNRLGPAALETPGPGQRQRAYLNLDNEQQFLNHLKEEAADGKLTTVAEIKSRLENHLGQPVHPSTVYRLLSRHEWKKKCPRPRHILSDPNEQEDKKKTSLTLLNRH